MKTEKLEKVGEIGVDAGLCWVGDPCYFIPDKDNPIEESFLRDWGDFCDKLDSEKEYPATKQWNYKSGHSGLGVSVTTGYGDGLYPVYVRRNKEGRIAEVRVVFIEE